MPGSRLSWWQCVLSIIHGNYSIYCISPPACTSPRPGRLQPPWARLNGGNYFPGCMQQRHAFHLHLDRERTPRCWFPLVSCLSLVPVAPSMQPGGVQAASSAVSSGERGRRQGLTAGERWSKRCCMRGNRQVHAGADFVQLQSTAWHVAKTTAVL